MQQNISIWVAFAAGFTAFFSPCLFPLIPGFVSMIAGESSENKNPLKILPSMLLFVIGFSLVFSLLGLSASYLGSFLNTYRDILTRIAGLFIIFMGLSVMRIIKIPFLMKEKRPIAYKGGSFMLGISFGLGWSPCLGLVLVGILALAGTTGSVVKGVTLLIAFCIGLGLPFIVFGTLFSYLITTFDFLKKYSKLIYMTSGIILISTGLLLVSGRFFLFANWLRSLF